MIKRIMIPRVIMDIDRHGFKRRHLTRKRVEERIILSTHSLVSTPNIPTIKKAGWGEVKRGPTAPVRRLHSLCQYTESVRLLGCLASLAFDLSMEKSYRCCTTEKYSTSWFGETAKMKAIISMAMTRTGEIT